MKYTLLKHFTICILLVSISLGVLGFQPTRAEADLTGSILGGAAGCTAGFFLNKGLGALGGLANPLNVQTDDTQNNAKESIADCIAYTFANILIDAITKSIVDWAQSGFDGNPAFVENLERFGQQTAESSIQNFYNRVPWDQFCSPFQLEVQIALLDVQTFDERVSCTLDDIVENVDDFIDGNFDEGGWNAWFHLTQNPANNPYGAYFLAEQELVNQVAQKQEEEKSLLNYGMGFFSKRQCSAYLICDVEDMTPEKQENYLKNPSGLVCDAAAKKVVPADFISDPDNDPRVLNCSSHEVLTPGNVVENQLNASVGSGLRRLEVADEINEILTALLTALINEVIVGDKGLRDTDTEAVQQGSFTAPLPLPELDVCVDFPELPGCSGAPETGGGGGGGNPTAGIGQCLAIPVASAPVTRDFFTDGPFTIPDIQITSQNQMGQMRERIPLGIDGHMAEMSLSYDFTLGTNALDEGSDIQQVHTIKNTGGDGSCFADFYIQESRNRVIFNTCQNSSTGRWTPLRVDLVPGTTYTVEVKYDAVEGIASLTLTDTASGAEVGSVSEFITGTIFPAGNGTVIEFGGGNIANLDNALPLRGSTYDNGSITLSPGGPICSGVTGGGGAGSSSFTPGT